MKFHNIRFGFATNSSSTHSIIVLPADLPKPATDEWSHFGWSYFTAADEKSKRNYALLLVEYTIRNCIRDSELFSYEDMNDLTDFFMSKWFDIAKPDDEDEGHIDHDSVFYLPRRWDGKQIHVEFAKAFVEYMANSNLAILGGNDNDDRIHHLFDVGEEWTHSEGFSGVVRYDEAYDYWTSFNRCNGTKTRFRLSDEDKPIEKSSYPELVDIKITDMCPYACAFCYMGSTGAGLHGSFRSISSIISELGKRQVFEIAIGGGEPTLHPDFIAILSDAKMKNIVANFTTKNLAWLRDPKQWTKIIPLCGAFAYSADNEDDVNTLAALLNLNGIAVNKAAIQIIPDVMDGWTLRRVLIAAEKHGFVVTLLGYKTTGRGKDYARAKSDWKSVINKMVEEGEHLPMIGVDTILASTSDLEGIDDRLFTLDEGKFSMYIDAVELKVGPSSFANEDEYTYLGAEARWKGRKVGYVNDIELPHNKWDVTLWNAYRNY